MNTSGHADRSAQFMALAGEFEAAGRTDEAQALRRAAQALRRAAQALQPGGEAPALPAVEDKKALVALFQENRLDEAVAGARDMALGFPWDSFAWKVLGAARQRLGETEAAVAANLAAVAADPADAEARFNLGVACQAAQRPRDAEYAYRAALEVRPVYPEALANLGNVLAAQERLAEAEDCYRKALGHKPDYAEAWNNLGVALCGLGRLEESAASHARAVDLRPDYAEGWNNLGNALTDLHHPDKAEVCHRRALRLRPERAAAWSNLGVALERQGRLAEAEECHRKGVALDPACVYAHNNLGNVLFVQGRLAEAEAAYRCAAAIDPEFTEAPANLGIVLGELGRPEEALKSYRRALDIDPDSPEVLSNLGALLRGLNRLDAAEECCRQALEIHPRLAMAHNNLGVVLKEAGRLPEALECFREALTLEPKDLEARSNLLYAQLYDENADPARLLAEAREYGRIAARAAAPYAAWKCEPDPRRLRVGLVSGDLRSHAAGHFLEGVLHALDPARVELVAYATDGREDELSARIRPRFSAWRVLPRGRDAAAAAVIHADAPHVLLDLSGHTARNRLPLFAFRPAPAQATWLGYAATTGLAEMDCLVADPVSLPEAFEAAFTESIVRLPETRLCFTPPAHAAPVAPPPALESGRVTFGCFNDLAKVNDGVVALWARVLAAVPGSRLLLKAAQLGAEKARQDMAARFAVHGADPARLLFEGAEPRADYLAAYARVDIALDPFPYPGGATSAEGLWMGVPLVTFAGGSFLARQGAGILAGAGLADWIAGDADAYVALAAAKAADLPGLARLRAGLREQVLASPLFDAARLARHLEDTLWEIWRRFGTARLAGKA